MATSQAELAQLVERNLAKVEVAGSSPVFRSAEKALRDALGAFYVYRQRGYPPVTSITSRSRDGRFGQGDGGPTLLNEVA